MVKKEGRGSVAEHQPVTICCRHSSALIADGLVSVCLVMWTVERPRSYGVFVLPLVGVLSAVPEGKDNLGLAGDLADNWPGNGRGSRLPGTPPLPSMAATRQHICWRCPPLGTARPCT